MRSRNLNTVVRLRVFVIACCLLSSSSPAAPQDGSAVAAATVAGTWSGTFFSKHPHVAPFTITVAVNQNARGHLSGTTSLDSECLTSAQLHVAVAGANVVFAGSDAEGDSITVRGSIDSSGTMMNTIYILNGSASGRCETDNGTGTLAKR